MTRKCPDLHDPLKPGFHSGGNGGQGHSHDEEDSAPLLGRWSEDKMEVGGIVRRVEIVEHVVGWVVCGHSHRKNLYHRWPRQNCHNYQNYQSVV